VQPVAPPEENWEEALPLATTTPKPPPSPPKKPDEEGWGDDWHNPHPTPLHSQNSPAAVAVV